MTVSRRHILPLLGLIGAGLCSLAAWHGLANAGVGLPDALRGKFRGTITGPVGTSGGDFTVVIERTDDGFAVRWPPRQAVTFRAAGRPGVFRTDGNTNPITGETAYWARIDGSTLIVYSMQIDEHGGYDIHNYIYAPAGDAIDLIIRRIRGGAGPVESRGRLEKYGR